MLKILQARLQQYVNRELPDVQAGFRKGRGTRDQIANNCLIIKKPREFQRNIYFCFIDYAEDFDCVDHNKLWKILKEMGFLFSTAAVLFYIPISKVCFPIFSTSLATLNHFLFFLVLFQTSAILLSVGWLSHCGLVCISLMS